MKRYKSFNKFFAFTLAAFFVISCFMIFNLYAQKQDVAEEVKTGKRDKPWETELTGWRVKDFKPYIKAMRDLQKVSLEYSEIILKLAIDEYSTGIDILEDMENEIIRIKQFNKKKKNLNERWYWQEIDRKNQEKRQLRTKKQEAKMKSITYFVKSINHLDEVSSKDVVERKEFMSFKARLFQVYVSTQYDLQNYLPCIPILERYITLTDKTRKDVWAYKYLSNCYAFMESVLTKYKHASEEKIIAFKQKKNKTLLQAAELQYGIDSVEYKHLNEVVGKDEIKNERLNDFR